jgi:uncharacterized LabA/DUF88 family protein
MIRTAILVDGGFYRKRAKYLWGDLPAEARAKELVAYCQAHVHYNSKDEPIRLYRVFYYDCEPIGRRSVYHPLKKVNIDLDKSETYTWSTAFLEELKKKRKFALRLGRMSDQMNYNLKPEITKALCSGKIKLEDLTPSDFDFNAQQKGVDMKIGVDIASLAYKKQVDQIILIAGDSDFVPAAKLARREGLDFILDPMGVKIKEDLFEHIDGLKSHWKNQGNQTRTSVQKI